MWVPAVGREGHLECPALVLPGYGLEGVPPVREPEAVGQHGRNVEPALAHQAEVVGDGVLAYAIEVFQAERVRPGEDQLLKIDGRGLPPLWRGHSGIDEPAPLRQHRSEEHTSELQS